MVPLNKYIWRITIIDPRRRKYLSYDLVGCAFCILAYPSYLGWDEIEAKNRLFKSLGHEISDDLIDPLFTGLISNPDESITFFPLATPELVHQINRDLSIPGGRWCECFGGFNVGMGDVIVDQVH